MRCTTDRSLRPAVSLCSNKGWDEERLEEEKKKNNHRGVLPGPGGFLLQLCCHKCEQEDTNKHPHSQRGCVFNAPIFKLPPVQPAVT